MGSHKIKRFVADTWKDYELLDSGEGAKLEKFGGVVLDRPEASAVWDRKKSFKEWDKAHSSFESTSKAAGYWKQNGKVPNSWNLEYKSEEHPSLRLKFNLETTRFKHIGIFPEQSCNWEYIAGKIKEGDKLLNLFAYTGGASLADDARKRLRSSYFKHIDTGQKYFQRYSPLKSGARFSLKADTPSRRSCVGMVRL